MADILLIHPAGIFEEAEIRLNPSYPPLGLAYIAAYLRTEGHRVKILDILGEGYDTAEQSGISFRVGLSLADAIAKIDGCTPDIIGISNPYTKNEPEAHQTAKAFKKRFPGSLLIMGGAHCSVLPEEVLKDDNVDLVCVGEGEITMSEISRCFDQCRSKDGVMNQCDNINGLAFVKDGAMHLTPERELIADLDELPMPARDLLPMKNYFAGQERNPFFMRSPSTSLITSRGCPYNCIYCSVRSVWGRSWRGRSPEKVVEEIRHLQETYGVREIAMCDDALACDTRRLKALCREILSRKIDIKWCTPNGVAIWHLDEECISLMKRSGCYRLTFGLETGDDETTAFIRKKYDRGKAAGLIRYANRMGFWTIGTFIIGFPLETKQAMENTLRYALDSEVDLAVFYSAYPFPGTDLNKIYRELGIFIPDDGSVTKGGTDTKYFKDHEISYLRNRFIKTVTMNRLLRSYRILYKLRSWEDIRFFMRISFRAWNIISSPLKKGKSTSGMLKD